MEPNSNEIRSSLVNSKDFKGTKESILEHGAKDNEVNFRVRLVEYIDDSSSKADDKFFYDMLEFLRFLDPSNDAVAYTTPEHLIYLNAPGTKIGKNYKQWDFVYDHECLHQLWDTFGVADKIKQKYGNYDHQLLNIASDCVINDYLSYYRHKEAPPFGITPEVLRDQFGVEYDRKVDTQFSLYCKMNELKEKLKEQLKDMFGDMDMEGGEGEDSKSQEDQDGQKSGQGTKSQSSNGSDKESGENGSEGDDNKGQGNNGNKNSKDKSGDGDEGDNGSKANGTGQRGKGQEGDGEQAGKGKSTERGQDSEKFGKGNDSEKASKQNAPGARSGEGGRGTHVASDADLENIKKKAQDIIDRYKNKISGEFGKFIAKCRASIELKESGLSVGKHDAAKGWNKQMNSYINAYVKKAVFNKKRQFERTWKKMPRRQGVTNFGDPLKKGKRIVKDNLTINVAFYIDISGSMYGDPITNAFKATYIICDSLKKQFGKEKVVDDVTFKIYGFDTSIHECPYGKTLNAEGGNMDFSEMIYNIGKRTGDYLINVIITDAGFSIPVAETKKFINSIKGMLLFITNIDSPEMKKLSKDKDFADKLFYVLADSQFTIH